MQINLDEQVIQDSMNKAAATAIANAAVRMIRESTIELILGLRKIPSYDAERLEKARGAA